MLIKRPRGTNHFKRFSVRTQNDILKRYDRPNRAKHKNKSLDVVILYKNPVTTEIRNKQNELNSIITKSNLVLDDNTKLFQEGFVYIISNPKFVGWLKIGMTIDFESRLNTYQIGDPDRGYKFEALKFVSNRREAEYNLLLKIESISSTRQGEWVQVKLEEALNLFEL